MPANVGQESTEYNGRDGEGARFHLRREEQGKLLPKKGEARTVYVGRAAVRRHLMTGRAVAGQWFRVPHPAKLVAKGGDPVLRTKKYRAGAMLLIIVAG